MAKTTLFICITAAAIFFKNPDILALYILGFLID